MLIWSEVTRLRSGATLGRKDAVQTAAAATVAKKERQPHMLRLLSFIFKPQDHQEVVDSRSAEASRIL
jgi:hypothetical protein